MNKTIALVPGDGIGPDVVAEAVNVLDAVAKKFGHSFSYKKVTAGGCAIDAFGHPLPQDQLQICKDSDAVLLGCRLFAELHILIIDSIEPIHTSKPSMSCGHYDCPTRKPSKCFVGWCSMSWFAIRMTTPRTSLS